MSKKDNRTRFTFRMPDELLEALRKKAEQKGVSVNSLILHILWNWEDKTEKQVIKREDDVVFNEKKEKTTA